MMYDNIWYTIPELTATEGIPKNMTNWLWQSIFSRKVILYTRRN